MQLLTQEIEQRHAQVRKRDVAPHSVNGEADGVVHAKLRSVLWSNSHRGPPPAVAAGMLHSYTFDRLTKAVGALLDRAVAAGEIRSDASPEDLLRALVGMCYMHDQPGWQSTVLRLLDVFVDGLRVRDGQKMTARSRPGAAKKSAARKKKR
jgi:hypothetical protein